LVQAATTCPQPPFKLAADAKCGFADFSHVMQNQQENALISSVFIVHAPIRVVSALHFRASLPMFAIANQQPIMPCEDDDILP